MRKRPAKPVPGRVARGLIVTLMTIVPLGIFIITIFTYMGYISF